MVPSSILRSGTLVVHHYHYLVVKFIHCNGHKNTVGQCLNSLYYLYILNKRSLDVTLGPCTDATKTELLEPLGLPVAALFTVCHARHGKSVPSDPRTGTVPPPAPRGRHMSPAGAPAHVRLLMRPAGATFRPHVPLLMCPRFMTILWPKNHQQTPSIRLWLVMLLQPWKCQKLLTSRTN